MMNVNTDENRGCSSCGNSNQMNNMMTSNMNNNCQDVTPIAALNNPMNMASNQNDCCNSSCCENENTRSEMLNEIKCLAFAIQELALYLDTHPDDEKALCLHNKYCREYRDLTDKYQKVYGPLTINCPCNKWRWLESPWPWESWEGGMF